MNTTLLKKHAARYWALFFCRIAGTPPSSKVGRVVLASMNTTLLAKWRHLPERLKDRKYKRYVRRTVAVFEKREETGSFFPFFRLNCIMLGLVSYMAFLYSIDAHPITLLPAWFVFWEFLVLKVWSVQQEREGNKEYA